MAGQEVSTKIIIARRLNWGKGTLLPFAYQKGFVVVGGGCFLPPLCLIWFPLVCTHVCVHSILQIIPHHPILLCLSPKPLPLLMTTSLVTLYRGPLRPQHSCLQPLPGLFSFAIPPRLASGFQRRLWPSHCLQSRFQCPPSSIMVPLGTFLISLLLQRHKTHRKQVTCKIFGGTKYTQS